MLRRGQLNRAQEERLRTNERRKECERDDHLRMVAQDRLLRSNMAADERVEAKRFVRQLQQERQEQDMQHKIVTSEKERVLREKQIQQEEKLAQVRTKSVKCLIYGINGSSRKMVTNYMHV